MGEPTSGGGWSANRGAISLRVRVLGKSAHVGLQHQGKNAFERMHEVVRRLQELKQEVEQRATTFNIGADQARQSILMLGGQSGGGTNFNVVPEECWFTIDRRINPEENLDEEKGRLIGVLEGCRREGIPLAWKILQEGQSSACGEEERLGVALTRIVRAVTGKAPRFEMCPGLLEIRFYAAQGVPAYAYGPGLLSVARGPNEYVDLRKVIDCAAIYALTAIEIFKQYVPGVFQIGNPRRPESSAKLPRISHFQLVAISLPYWSPLSSQLSKSTIQVFPGIADDGHVCKPFTFVNPMQKTRVCFAPSFPLMSVSAS